MFRIYHEKINYSFKSPHAVFVLVATYVIVSVEEDMTKAMIVNTTTPVPLSGKASKQPDSFSKQSTKQTNESRETTLTNLINTLSSTKASTLWTNLNTAASIKEETLSNKATMIYPPSTVEHASEIRANIQQSNDTEEKAWFSRNSSAPEEQFTKETHVSNETTLTTVTDTSPISASTNVSGLLTIITTGGSTKVNPLSNEPKMISTSPTIFSTKSLWTLSKSTGSATKESTFFESESTSFESLRNKLTKLSKQPYQSRNVITTPKSDFLVNQTSEVQVSTTETKVCRTGSCSGADSCVDTLAYMSCDNGVCMKIVTRYNGTYSDYVMSCNTTYTTCDSFLTSAANATPGSTCCDTSSCDKYISAPGNFVQPVSANMLLLVIMAVSCYLLVL
ncbi:mucin-17-like isoform X2 [Mercenaria mercenaria]|nr:mucin-17-like isoform X2 [Mercenaria mercenaria]